MSQLLGNMALLIPCILHQVAHSTQVPQAHLAHLVHLEETEEGLDQVTWANTLQNTFRVSYVFIYFGSSNATI